VTLLVIAILGGTLLNKDFLTADNWTGVISGVCIDPVGRQSGGRFPAGIHEFSRDGDGGGAFF
jgi:hypothetical protein